MRTISSSSVSSLTFDALDEESVKSVEFIVIVSIDIGIVVGDVGVGGGGTGGVRGTSSSVCGDAGGVPGGVPSPTTLTCSLPLPSLPPPSRPRLPPSSPGNTLSLHVEFDVDLMFSRRSVPQPHPFKLVSTPAVVTVATVAPVTPPSVLSSMTAGSGDGDGEKDCLVGDLDLDLDVSILDVRMFVMDLIIILSSTFGSRDAGSGRTGGAGNDSPSSEESSKPSESIHSLRDIPLSRASMADRSNSAASPTPMTAETDMCRHRNKMIQ